MGKTEKVFPEGLFNPEDLQFGIKNTIKKIKKVKKKKKKKIKIQLLSSDEENPSNNLKIKKNSTSLSKSEEIQKNLNELKILKINYQKKKEEEKKKIIKINFKYFDGFQNKYFLIISKNTKISDFLEFARILICKDYPKYSQIKGDNILMLVIGKTIIPDNLSFLDVEILFLENFLKEDFFFKKDKGVFCLENEKVKIVDKLIYQDNVHSFPVKNWVHLEIEENK